MNLLKLLFPRLAGSENVSIREDSPTPRIRKMLRRKGAQEISDTLLKVKTQVAEVGAGPAPTADEIRSQVSTWALNLARGVAIPTARTDVPLENLTAEERKTLLEAALNLQREFS